MGFLVSQAANQLLTDIHNMGMEREIKVADIAAELNDFSDMELEVLLLKLDIVRQQVLNLQALRENDPRN